MTAKPKRLGEYDILGVLGQGGMAVVYRAQQQSPQRVVALKVLRPDVSSPEANRRLALEAEVLARLKHPGIARVFEAGAFEAEDGSLAAFFAMELVEGALPVDEHARRNDLDTRARVELLATACDAVQHAHEAGVIHRDLKPANVLADADGRLRVLDFGVARVTDWDLKATTLETRSGDLIGTLAYMSPEQARGDVSQIDERSDVHALGVLGHELLSGRLPHDLGGVSLPEAVRRICDDEPMRLGSVRKELRGDLETIMGKAMEKSRSRRYASAADLAADLRRYLAHEPILAKPPTVGDVLSKFARRNRALVFGVGAAFVLLILGSLGTGLGLVHARREAAAAEAERDRARAVRDFFVEVLSSPAPQILGPDATVLEALARAREIVGERFADAPEIRGDIHLAIGMTARHLSDVDVAEAELRQARELRLLLHGEVHAETVEATLELASTLSGFTRRDDPANLREAEQLLTLVQDAPALDGGRSALGVRWLSCRSGFEVARSDLAKGRRLAQQALDGARALREAPGDLVATQAETLAVIERDLGRLEESERLIREAIDLRVALHGPADVRTLLARRELADTLRRLRRFDDCVATYRELIPDLQRVMGEDHRAVLGTMNNLGSALRSAGRPEQAVSVLQQAVALGAKRHGIADGLVVSMRNMLTGVLRAAGRSDAAIVVQRTNLDAVIQEDGEDAYFVFALQASLGILFGRSGRDAEGLPLVLQRAERARIVHPTRPDLSWRLEVAEAFLRAGLGQRAEAEAVLDELLARPEASRAPGQGGWQGALDMTLLLAERLGREEDAARLREVLGTQ